ncbi:MAG TPA: SDR family NAD(P)-dependent oxidoreductase [Casimicrobiaceae bacterium]
MGTDLSGRIALVTGGARGIGARIAQALDEQGASVYVADISAEGAAACAATLGSKSRGVAMDVTDRRQVDATTAAIVLEHGAIDILVNNAGLVSMGAFSVPTNEEWERMVSVNLTGIFNCVQAAAPAMIAKRRGVIINLASVAAAKGGGSFGNVWYGATKAGVVALTKGLARELGPHNVRVNAIAPSAIDTDMLKGVLTPQVRASVIAHFPLGRLASADDVANLAVYLASDLASFITGETVAVDGGFLKT